MKKIFILILHFIQVLLIIGMQVIHYFTRTKMGMARHMVYFGRKVEAYKLLSFPIINIIYIVLLILALVLFIKLYKIVRYESGILLIYSIYSCIMIFLAFKNGVRDYYANIIVQSLVIFIQAIIVVNLSKSKNSIVKNEP